MTSGQFVDLVLSHWIDIRTTDANSATWRTRALEALQETVEEFTDCNDWMWKVKKSTVAVSAGAESVNAPTDLHIISENGGVYLNGVVERLFRWHPNLLWRAWWTNSGESGATGQPTAYSLVTNSGSTSYLPVIHFDWTTDQAYTLTLVYDIAAPLLTDKPTAPTLAAAAGAGVTAGAHLYVVTFIASDGSESEAGSSATVTTSGGNLQVNVTAIPTGNASVTSRKLYRTTAGGSTYKLLTTISDNTTTTYTDNTADASLGATLSSASNLQIIPAQYHRSVLLPGVRARLAPAFGDARKAEFRQDFDRALAQAKSRHAQGQEDEQRIGMEGYASYGSW